MALRPPTEAWVREAFGRDAGLSWSALAAAASDAAVLAAAQNRVDAMEGWLMAARWARLLGTDQRVIVQRWIEAMNTAKLGHANMKHAYEMPAEPLSTAISQSFFIRLVADAALSRDLFDLLSPYDFLPGVLGTLERLHAADAALFAQYQQLALAIALVYDVPPPPQWPHAQVSAGKLSRQRADAVAVFAFWTEADRRRLTLHRLNRLDAAELKFVVDAAAPFPELVWAQQRVQFDFDGLPRAYDAVRYIDERAERQIYAWPGPRYTLPDILATGGICIDQAYFASEVGKARGVPTLLFRGAGLDGRHAWFGYLDARQTWQFDVGRYAEQKLVVGVAFDPQTWGEVNDHELTFLAERFRRLPSYQQSRARQAMAQEFLRRNQPDKAVAVATRAANQEPRNVDAWEVLVVAERAAERPAVQREATLRRAARALQRYPDLNARFMREVIAVLRERGQTSAADHEQRMLAQKFTVDRSDLALAQAAEMLNRSLAEDPPATQLRVFESALRQFGFGAGMKAFDQLVQPFFRQAMTEGRKGDAQTILVITVRLLPIEAGSQFAREIDALAKEAR